MIHLQSNIEDKANKSEDRAKGKGILKKIMTYKVVWCLHFLKDVLTEIPKFTLLLQRKDITLPSVMNKIQSAQLTLCDDGSSWWQSSEVCSLRMT